LLLTKLKLPHPFISTMGNEKIARGLSLAVTAAAPVSGFAVPVKF
jgi:ribose transport system permease protein